MSATPFNFKGLLPNGGIQPRSIVETVFAGLLDYTPCSLELITKLFWNPSDVSVRFTGQSSAISLDVTILSYPAIEFGFPQNEDSSVRNFQVEPRLRASWAGFPLSQYLCGVLYLEEANRLREGEFFAVPCFDNAGNFFIGYYLLIEQVEPLTDGENLFINNPASFDGSGRISLNTGVNVIFSTVDGVGITVDMVMNKYDYSSQTGVANPVIADTVALYTY